MFFYTKSQFRHRAGMAKILLVMRLIIVLLTTAILQVSAAGYAQRVTLKQNNAPLATVLDEIRKQTGYDFLYSDRVMNTARRVSLNLSDVSVDEALEICFKDQPLSYKVEDKMVIIKPKEPTFLVRLANRWAAIDVHGRVVDQEGRPLSGATVKIKSSGKSVSTNAKGEFYLEKVDEGAVLVISFIGYVNKEVDAAKEMGDIVLEVSDSKLDEVQVIAYGTTTRRLSTGNISSITSADIEKQPVTNPLLALSGRVPGVFIEQSTGLPGGAVKVRIQGTNSLENGNEPLYVIDGVPYPSKVVPGVDAGLANVGSNGSPLNFINPSDIERIDVLKDADATSIYGSRAANGAILITTKKGKMEATTFDFNLQSGLGQMTRRLKLLNTEEYIEMRKEAAKNDNIDYVNDSRYNNPSGSFRDLLTWDQHRYTDWQNVLLGGKAYYNNYKMSISGGNISSNYLIGSTYHRETSVFEGNSANTFGTLHFNVNNSSVNKRLLMQLTGSYQSNVNNLVGADLTGTALLLSPNAPALYNVDGSMNWAQASNGISTWTNPLAMLLSKYQNKTGNLLGNAILNYQLLPGLSVKSSFGYTNLQTNEYKINPIAAAPPERRAIAQGSALFGNNNLSSWLVEPQLVYKWIYHKHTIDALVGATFQENKSIGQQFNAIGYNTDQVLEDIRSATNVSVTGTINTIYRYTAMYGRLNYAFDNKYVIGFTARNDGSSRFGPNKRFHTFSSGSAAWLFSSEEFIKKSIPILSFGKLRGSYGTTGSDQIGDYQYLSLYNFTNMPRAYQGSNGIAPSFLNNPYFQWESTRKLSIGIDLGFAKDRLLFTVNYNRNKSSNQLLNYDLPIITGFYGLITNFPATLQNTGWELSLNTVNVHSKDFTWSSNINFTVPRNKLIAFPGLTNSSYVTKYIIGQSVNIVQLYKWRGVDSKTGLYQFETSEGSLTSSPDYTSDRLATINPDPKFYGGFQNSLSYKGFTLDMLITFTKQMGQNYLNGFVPGGRSNQPISVLKRWREIGDVTTMQMFATGLVSGNQLPMILFSNNSDGQLGDASYIRVKNVALSWKLPEDWLRKSPLNNCRIYLQGQNLFTITNYIGLDPESRSFNSNFSLPPLRVITAGIKVTL